MMSNLLGEASRLKSEGKLNADALSNLKNTLTPFLNSNQIEMLNYNTASNFLKYSAEFILSLPLKISSNKLRNSYYSPQTKLRMNFSKEKDKIGNICFTESSAYLPPKKVEDFLKIPAGTIFDNMSGACRRCEILEKLVSAMQRDIKSLQNQNESLLKNPKSFKGKKEDDSISPLELSSKDIYKFPEFGVLFPTGIRQFDGVLKKKSKEESPSKTSFGGLRRRPSQNSDYDYSSPMLKKRNSVNINVNFNRLLSDLSPYATPNKRASKADTCITEIGGSNNGPVNVKDQRAMRVERYEQEIDSLRLKVTAYEKKKRDFK